MFVSSSVLILLSLGAVPAAAANGAAFLRGGNNGGPRFLLTNHTTDESDSSGMYQQHAMTAWWVIFNNPDACLQYKDSNNTTADDDDGDMTIKCGPVDVFGSSFLEAQTAGNTDFNLINVNKDSGMAMLYATGGVTDPNTGFIRMQASIFKSSDTNLTLPYAMDPMAQGITLQNPNAEVHVILRDHGTWVGDDAQTLADIDEYCNDPPFLWKGPQQNLTGNICTDFQAVEFGSGEAGSKPWKFVSTGKVATMGSAKLFRQGDGLQLIVETNVLEDPYNEENEIEVERAPADGEYDP